MLQTNVSWEHNFIPTSQVRYFAYLVNTKKQTNKTKQSKTKKTKNIYVPNLDIYERKCNL